MLIFCRCICLSKNRRRIRENIYSLVSIIKWQTWISKKYDWRGTICLWLWMCKVRLGRESLIKRWWRWRKISVTFIWTAGQIGRAVLIILTAKVDTQRRTLNTIISMLMSRKRKNNSNMKNISSFDDRVIRTVFYLCLVA